MGANMGKIDKGLRLAIAAVLLYLTLGTGILSGALMWVALAVAGVFSVTALMGFCPLYRLIGLKTCRNC